MAGVNPELSLRVTNTQTLNIGSHILHLVREGAPTTPVQITVLEEDTWQLMSADNHIPDYSTHPVRVMTDLIDQKPVSPGTILRGNRQWKMIVYDLDQDPVSQAGWIESATLNLLSTARQHGLRSLSIPLSGCRHGPISAMRSFKIFLNSLKNWQTEQSIQVNLICSPDHYETLCNNHRTLLSHTENLNNP